MAFRELRASAQDTAHKLEQKLVDILAIALGQRGHDRFNGATSATSGEWAILHAITAATVTVIRDGITEAGITLIAGDRIYGQISSVTVTSGDVELYRDN